MLVTTQRGAQGTLADYKHHSSLLHIAITCLCRELAVRALSKMSQGIN